MDGNELRPLQAPLKKRYREQPETERTPARAEAVLKASSLLPGTEGSNPVPSSGESSANLTWLLGITRRGRSPGRAAGARLHPGLRTRTSRNRSANPVTSPGRSIAAPRCTSIVRAGFRSTLPMCARSCWRRAFR
jgi:hypothetical protein